jgi:hypothetical protein
LPSLLPVQLARVQPEEQGQAVQARQVVRHRAALVPPAARREGLAQQAALAQSVAWVHLGELQAVEEWQEMCRAHRDNTHSRLTAALRAVKEW